MVSKRAFLAEFPDKQKDKWDAVFERSPKPYSKYCIKENLTLSFLSFVQRNPHMQGKSKAISDRYCFFEGMSLVLIIVVAAFFKAL